MRKEFRKKINIIRSALREVFQHSNYVAFGLISALTVGLGIVLLSSYRLIIFALKSDIFDWGAKFKVIWTSLGLFTTNFTITSQVMIVIVALLAGVNIAMLIFYFKRRMAVQRAAGTSAIGLIVGMFGVGCSACGSVVLSSLIGITSASALISTLPLHGIEFGLASIALIGFSIYLLAKKIHSPAICNSIKS